MLRKIFCHQCGVTLRKPEKQFECQQNLAYTPSQMNQLREKGIPISNMMVSEKLYDDGDSTGSMSFDPVLARGVNEIDAWNMEMEAKKNLLRGHLNDKAMFDEPKSE